MSSNTEFRNYILDQLSAMGAFETKNMFGGTALLRNGSAFAKIKHGILWLKVADNNINDFIEKGMTNTLTTRIIVVSLTFMMRQLRF